MSKRIVFALAVLSVLTAAGVSQAAFEYTGGLYSQNFDTLPTPGSPGVTLDASLVGSGREWQDDRRTPGGPLIDPAPDPGHESIIGWYLWHPLDPGAEDGFDGRERLRAGAGAANTGSFWSYGVAGVNAVTDRAMGVVGSTTIANNPPPPTTNMNEIYIGLRLLNPAGSGVSYDSFTLVYTGEQWREALATSTGQQLISPSWRLGGTTVESGGFTAMTGASAVFDNPHNGPGAGTGARDGNLAINRVTGLGDTISLSSDTWDPGEELWIRWTYTQQLSNDHGLAIDDVGFEAREVVAAVPEPASLAVWACLVVLGIGARSISDNSD